METLDANIRRVAAQKETWENLSARSKLSLIDQLMDRLKENAEDFLEAAVEKRDFVEVDSSCLQSKDKDNASHKSSGTVRGSRNTAGQEAEPAAVDRIDMERRTTCEKKDKDGYEDLIKDRRDCELTKLASETNQLTHSVLVLATWLSITRETYAAIARTGKPPLPLGVESLQRPRRELAAAGVKRDLSLVKVGPRGLLFATLLTSGSAYLAVDGPVEQVPVTQREGGVVAILGAGNFDATADIVNALFIDNSVCLYKPSTLSGKLIPVLKKIFAPLLREDFLFFVEADTNAESHFLLHHPLVTKWYLTGSVETANRILWDAPDGPSASASQQQQQQLDERKSAAAEQPQEKKEEKEQQEEKKEEEKEQQQRESPQQQLTPKLNKSCILELGSCTPWLVAPGRWSDRALHWHARNIAFALLFNGGHICVHPQLLITSKRWPQREKFLRLVRQYQQEAIYIGCFYPGYSDKMREAREKLLALGLQQADFEIPVSVPLSATSPRDDSNFVIFATDLPEENFLTHEEAFSPVCGEVALDTPATAADFLAAAVPYVNTRVRGTLMIPLSIRVENNRDEQALKDAILNLEYGSILINVVPLISFVFPNLLWGSYPSSTFTHLQSGISHFGNVDGYKRPVKSVVRAPFYNFSQLVLMPWTKKNVHQMNKIMSRTVRAFLDRRASAGWFTSTQHITKITAAFLANL